MSYARRRSCRTIVPGRRPVDHCRQVGTFIASRVACHGSVHIQSDLSTAAIPASCREVQGQDHWRQQLEVSAVGPARARHMRRQAVDVRLLPRYGCSVNRDRGETVCADKGRYRRDALKQALMEA